MTFLEFIGPTKALIYGLAGGFLIGVLFSIWCSVSTRKPPSCACGADLDQPDLHDISCPYALPQAERP
jgi:hypothetical protein